MDTANQPTPQTISVASEWNQAATEATQWAEQATTLARLAHSQMAEFSAEDSKKAADLANAASRAPGKMAAELRQSAVGAAETASVQAQVVISDLESAIQRAKAAGKMDAAALMEAEAATWAKAQEIANRLAKLSEQLQVEEASMIEDKLSQEKKWWQFWK
jgi:hypothetical protein